jgi:hypothetical protein
MVKLHSVNNVEQLNEMLKDPYPLLYESVTTIRYIVAETKRPSIPAPADVAPVCPETATPA